MVVVGGGPAGATAADDLARQGHSVLLLDRAGRIKPCGGAIPPRLIKDFAIPDHLLVARIRTARMVSPADQRVDLRWKCGRHAPRRLSCGWCWPTAAARLDTSRRAGMAPVRA